MGNNNSTSKPNSLENLEKTLADHFNPKLWNKFIDFINTSCKSLADLFGKDIDDQEKALYTELFNSMDYLINHITTLKPRIENCKGQFDIIDNLLNQKGELSDETKNKIKIGLDILSKNYASIYDLGKRLDRNHKLHKEILKHQEKILNELNKKCLILSDSTYSFLNKHKSKLVIGGVLGGGFAGGVTTVTLFGVSAFGGVGNFIAAGLSLTAVSHVVGAILLGVLITSLVSGNL